MDDHGISERIPMQCAGFPTFAVDRSTPRPVTTLRSTVSPQLQEAIKELVRLKHEADQLIGTRVSALFSDELPGRGGSTLDGIGFARGALPFLEGSQDGGFPARVPIDLVIGESWRWLPSSVDADQTASLGAHLLSDERTDLTRKDYADYIYWPDLGLFIGHEGKNRVQFLRSIGATHIPAYVSYGRYPSAERIERYAVSFCGRREVWAVLDRRWVQRVLLHGLSDRVLTAYGIAPPSAWPREFPKPHDLATHFEESGASAVIDMSSAQHRRVRAQERIQVSVSDIRGLRWRGRLALRWLSCAFVAAIIVIVGHGYVREAAVVVLAAFSGGCLTVTTPLFTARRELTER